MKNMAGLILKNVYKIYSSYDKKDQAGVQAVTDFNLEIKDGEFIVFVGPSGCGKSTTLRMIAGLENISRGKIYIDETKVNDVPAKDRNIAMVFQNYALYPHMTAYDNIAFVLKIKKKKIPVLDENGNQVFIVDKKKIKQLQYEIDLVKKTFYYDPKIQELLKEIEYLKENPSIVKTHSNGKEYRLIDKKKIKELQKEIEVFIEEDKVKGNKECNDAIERKTNRIKDLIDHPSLPSFIEKHYSKNEIKEKVLNAAKILGIENLLNRKPKEMSGGQRQRVALGRALVRKPAVFLLDEPLSNLDAKLRVSMRSEIIKLHKSLNTTFIYVTHDQTEAMTMGDRIVVMKDGLIQQVDSPSDIFDYPCNTFVAGFIGTPQMNFFDVKMKKVKDKISFVFEGGEEISYLIKEMRKIDDKYLDGNEHLAILGIRGENIKSDKKGISLKILGIENFGNETQLILEGEEVADVSKYKDINIKVPYRVTSKIGDVVKVSFDEHFIHLFDKKTQSSIMERTELKQSKENKNF